MGEHEKFVHFLQIMWHGIYSNRVSWYVGQVESTKMTGILFLFLLIKCTFFSLCIFLSFTFFFSFWSSESNTELVLELSSWVFSDIIYQHFISLIYLDLWNLAKAKFNFYLNLSESEWKIIWHCNNHRSSNFQLNLHCQFPLHLNLFSFLLMTRESRNYLTAQFSHLYNEVNNSPYITGHLGD